MIKDEKLNNIINNGLLLNIKTLENITLMNEEAIINFFKGEVIDTDNKEKMLLNFRRGLEMLINAPLILTVKSLSSNKLIVVREDNIFQLLDSRYYSTLQMSSFLNIFELETNNFKAIWGNNETKEPHLKVVINYILSHYNTTFTKFMNRNKEYYIIYKFFFDNGIKIKEILQFLNAYHYSEDNGYYLVGIEEFKDDVYYIYEEICKMLEKI